MKILVTGTQGQLGSEMKKLLEEKIPGASFFTERDSLDLTDPIAIRTFIDANEITHIVNCAQFSDIDLAEEHKLRCAAINVNAVKNLANAADSAGVKIIHLSTPLVFDGKTNRPYRESDKVNPTTQFGTTKRSGETALIALAPESIIIRAGWIFSPHGKNNFVIKTLSTAANSREIKAQCDYVGTPTYARDLAEAIWTILCSKQWVPGIYHYSNEGICSRYDFARAILKHAGIENCKAIPAPAEDFQGFVERPFYTVLDKGRIKATYGISIPHWEDSLEHCIDRILKQK